MIDFRIKRMSSFLGDGHFYAKVLMTIDNGTFDLGLLDAEEAKDLIASLQGAIDELKWIFPEDETNEDD